MIRASRKFFDTHVYLVAVALAALSGRMVWFSLELAQTVNACVPI